MISVPSVQAVGLPPPLRRARSDRRARTARLAQILLGVQALFIAALVFGIVVSFVPGQGLVPPTVVAALVVVGVAEIVTALNLRRGRKWAAILSIGVQAWWIVASTIGLVQLGLAVLTSAVFLVVALAAAVAILRSWTWLWVGEPTITDVPR